MCFKLLVFFILILAGITDDVNGSLLKRMLGIRNKSLKIKNKIYPLSLIQTDKGFKLPLDLDYKQKSGRQRGTKRRFKTKENEQGVFFCPDTNTAHVQKKMKISKSLKKVYSITHDVNNSCPLMNNVKIQSYETKSNPECETTNDSIPGIWKTSVENEQHLEKSKIPIEYSFGYVICYPKTKEELLLSLDSSRESIRKLYNFTIYKFFYNTRAKEVLFTIHDMNMPFLLDSPQLEDDRNMVFENDTNGFGIFNKEFEERKTLFNEIEKISEYRSKKLISPNDFPFALWRKITYHYLNIGLMHKDLMELWNYMEDTLRKKFIFIEGAIRVYTGAFKIPIPKDLRGVLPSKFLNNYKIPQMWVKFIHSRRIVKLNSSEIVKRQKTKEIAENQMFSNNDEIQGPTSVLEESKEIHKALLIIGNNYLEMNMLAYIVFNYCPNNYCRNFAKQIYPQVYQHVWCCSVTEASLRLFGLNFEFDGVLSINGFTSL